MMKKGDCYHFIGIGGIGMSGLARLLLERGCKVRGSDKNPSKELEELSSLGAEVIVGHGKQNIQEGFSLVISSGIRSDNVELCQAKELGLKIMHRSDLLAAFLSEKKALVIAGTHGKTTTTSLLTETLIEAGLDPSYAIGGVLVRSSLNAKQGSREIFVAEGDESDGTFLKYSPEGAIITNIDNDHIDFWGSETALLKGFHSFADQVKDKKHLFVCHDCKLLAHFPGISYGFSEGAVLQGRNFQQGGVGSTFDIEFRGTFYSKVYLNLSGIHNAQNALAVFGMAISLGVNENQIRRAFSSFTGVKRRQEKKGSHSYIDVIDDYGHHPTEIQATLRGLKSAVKERRLVALFQPHRYSRTKLCLEQFGKCFDHADLVLVTDIYAAGEDKDEEIDAEKVVLKIKESSQVPVFYVPKEELLEKTLSHLVPGDFLVTLGAGDISSFGPKLLDDLKERGGKKLKVGLLFGGQSSEHEISLLSASNIRAELEKGPIEISHFYIGKNGVWTSDPIAKAVLDEKKPCNLEGEVLPEEVLKDLSKTDLVFPVLHGPNGEDGTVQGFLKTLQIPFASCDHTSSAITMDKALTKKLAAFAGLKVAPFLDFSAEMFEKEPERIVDRLVKELCYPMFVKPVHLGSTVGVKKARNQEELVEAIHNAFSKDTHVVVEKEIIGREIEFALFGKDDPVVFPPGEIFTGGAVYDFDSKYSVNCFSTTSQAKLDEEVIKKGMEFAKSAYVAARCDSYARVDCFLTKGGEFILNEINPIPGFTAISLYPKICEANGLAVKDLLLKLIWMGLKRARSELCLGMEVR